MLSLGIAFPESELRNDFATKPDGSMGEYQTPVSVRDAITAGMRKPDYSGIRVPVLAFFTLPAPLCDPAVPIPGSQASSGRRGARLE